MLRNMTYECDKENVTSVKDKIMDRIEFHEISISEMIFLMVVYMRGSRFFLGRRRKIMFASGDGEGGGRAFISYNLVYNVI